MERLLSLLSSNDQMIRRQGVMQICKYIDKEKSSLPFFLLELYKLLFSKDWDTRVSGGEALYEISKIVARDDDMEIDGIEKDKRIDNGMEIEGRINLELLSHKINDIILHASELLSSDGKEFNILEEFTEKNFIVEDSMKRCARQRLVILRKIGLNDGSVDVPFSRQTDIIDSIISLSDIQKSMETQQSITEKQSCYHKEAKNNDPASLLTGMSMRERNLARRKSLMQTEKGYNTDFRIKDHDSDWIFTNLIEELSCNLFAAKWEQRHGSAIGLQRILKNQFHTVGRKNRKEDDERNKQWLEDCVCKCICVLALERFTDFLGEVIVCPVQQVVTQLIATILPHLERTAISRVINLLCEMMAMKDHIWYVRHAAVLASKYTLAILPHEISILKSFLPPLSILLFHDSSEDVKYLVCEILRMPFIIEGLKGLIKEGKEDELAVNKMIHDMCLYICTLRSEDEISINIKEMLLLLSKIISIATIPISSSLPIASLLPYLFLSSAPQIRLATLILIKQIIELSNTTIKEKDGNEILHHLFLAAMVESHVDNLQAYIDTFACIIDKNNKSMNIKMWKSLFLICKEVTSKNVHSLLKEIDNNRYASQVDISTHFNLHFIGQRLLSVSLCVNESLFISFCNSIREYLQSNNAAFRICALCVLFNCLMSPTFAYSKNFLSISNLLVEILNEPDYTRRSEFYLDLEALEDELVNSFDNFINFASSLGIETKEDLSEGVTIARARRVSIDGLASYLAQIDEFSFSLGKSTNNDSSFGLNQKNQKLIQAIDMLESKALELDVSVNGLAASCLVLGNQEDKVTMNILIKSLMDSLKGEADVTLQRYSCLCLSRLTLTCKPSVGNKIVKNLIVLSTTVPLLKEHFIRMRGCEESLKTLCQLHETSLFSVFPVLKESLDALKSPTLSHKECGPLAKLVSLLLNHINASFHNYLIQIFPSLCNIYIRNKKMDESDYEVEILKCILSMCRNQNLSVVCMDSFLSASLPFLSSFDSDIQKEQVLKIVHDLCSSPSISYIPHLVILTLPVMKCMSYSHVNIRKLSTQIFSYLTPLLTIEDTFSSPSQWSKEFISFRNNQRTFIEQFNNNTVSISNSIAFSNYLTKSVVLRDYQIRGIQWLLFLDKFGLNGILGDDMGLGKSLQSLTCLITSMQNNSVVLPSLIICPNTLVSHWCNEAKVFFPSCPFTFISYKGSVEERRVMRKSLKSNVIIVMSYNIARQDANELAKWSYFYCILDEGHIIKNSKTQLTQALKTFKCQHKLILSGTPIQNRPQELWSLFDFLMPGYLCESEKEFKKVYIDNVNSFAPQAQSDLDFMIDSHTNAIGEEDLALMMSELRKKVKPFVLRRMKDDVLTDLPAKMIQDYYCDLSPLQEKVYSSFLSSSSTVIQHLLEETQNTSASTSSSKGSVLQVIQQLRKIVIHPSLVSNECSLIHWSSNVDQHHIFQSGKMEALYNLLLECNICSEDTVLPHDKHRVLIFAQLKDTLNIISKVLFDVKMPNLKYKRIDGDVETHERFQIAQSFNNDESIDVLLLTTKVGGLGLNLTGADVVIFMEHDWNPMQDLQAMDRAHRIGQKRKVNVYRLITKNTIEESIMGMQNFKKKIATAIILSNDEEKEGGGENDLISVMDSSSTSRKRKRGEDDIVGGGEKGLADLINNLPELWDESQYDDFSFEKFIKEKEEEM